MQDVAAGVAAVEYQILVLVVDGADELDVGAAVLRSVHEGCSHDFFSAAGGQ